MAPPRTVRRTECGLGAKGRTWVQFRQITWKSEALSVGATLQRREQDRGAGAVAVGVVEQLAGGAVVDDPVVGIAGRRCR